MLKFKFLNASENDFIFGKILKQLYDRSNLLPKYIFQKTARNKTIVHKTNLPKHTPCLRCISIPVLTYFRGPSKMVSVSSLLALILRDG